MAKKQSSTRCWDRRRAGPAVRADHHRFERVEDHFPRQRRCGNRTDHRGVAARCKKLATHHIAMVKLASTQRCIRILDSLNTTYSIFLFRNNESQYQWSNYLI